MVWAAAIPSSQYNMPVENLNLTMRTLNCLKRAAIHKVGEVLERDRDELLRIRSRSAVRIVGINYKDDAAKARRWLAEYGDPYALNLIDADGALGVELGVYGAPETFLLNADGEVVFKQVGAIDRAVWRQEIAPRLAAMGVALAGGEARGDAG